MKDFFIADAAKFDNESVTSYFALSSLQLREKKQGGQFLALILADKTGTMEARMWEEFSDAFSTCGEGCYVKVQGQISKYQGKYQITLQKMRSAAESEIDAGDYQPATRFDVDEMWVELRGYVSAFANEDLKRLVFAFLDDEEIGGAYRVAPAAKTLHHAWLGGLLEHVLTLVRVCRATVPFYPEVDGDLLVTGAILHDIGKVKELAWKSSFSYTLEGQMIGHISIAQGMLREKLIGLEPFPAKLRVLVEHMILSHHGKYEFGSPKLPMTPEAILLSALDDLEAKMQNMRAEFAKELTNGKSGAGMTEWVRSMERPLLNSKAYLAGGVGMIEDLRGLDHAPMLRLNNDHALETSELDLPKIKALLEMACYARGVDGGATALLIALDQDADYKNPNFAWFKAAYEGFVYIDRVIVADAARGRGIAKALYEDLFTVAKAAGQDRVVCEVNLNPPNAASEAFHAAMGFAAIGQQAIHGGAKTVRYFAKRL